MFSRIYIEDIDIVKTFASECKEYLEKLEKEILKLEIRSEDIELHNQIARRVHSIKRGSSFAGLPVITRLSRATELLLDAIKDRRVSVDKELIDNLLLSADFLNAYLKELHEKLTEHDFDVEAGLMYLEFESEQDEEQVLESLRQALKNARSWMMRIVNIRRKFMGKQTWIFYSQMILKEGWQTGSGNSFYLKILSILKKLRMIYLCGLIQTVMTWKPSVKY